MPRRTPKVCADRRCPDLTDGGTYCEQHTPEPWAGSTRSQRLPPDWNRKRRRILRRDKTCQLRYPGCVHLPTEVDHREPGDNHDDANLQAVCAPCHRTKTQAEAADARRAG